MTEKWIKKYFEMAKLVASWSKDPSRTVGAVIIPKNLDIPIVGYNGFPRGVGDTFVRISNRETRLKMIIHAEPNAIANAGRLGVSCEGATMLVTTMPCGECAKTIIQSGIKTVHYIPSTGDFEVRWAESIKITKELFQEAGVELILNSHIEPVATNTQ